MNRNYVLWNLKEAKEGLDRTIAELQGNADYDVGEFIVALTHVYHHLNTAWNARDASVERAQVCSERDFRAWRQFPADIPLD